VAAKQVEGRKLSMAKRDLKNTSDIHKVSLKTKTVFKGRNTNIV
jgi:hypothetical protein